MHPTLATSSTMPMLDTGATHSFYRDSDVCSTMFTPVPHVPLPVLLPNSSILNSTATAQTSFGGHTYSVNVFPDDKMAYSLESAATFTNEMKGSILFTETGATIFDSAGRVINFSPKEADARTWTFDRHAPAPSSSCNSVVRHDLQADFVAYAHASFNSPPNSTMRKAIQAGWLRGYPRLTLSMWDRNAPTSTATDKGHLDFNRQGQRPTSQHATVAAPINSDAATVADSEPPPNVCLCFVRALVDTDANYSDLPSRFPVPSLTGNEYILLSVFNGYVFTVAMQDRSAPSLIAAYKSTFDHYRRAGHTPKYQRLDNETSTALERFFVDEAKVEFELCPPYNHRTNPAEIRIRTWKNHLISGLSTSDPQFPLAAWDEVLPQTDSTYNILHAWSRNPKLSAYEGFHGHPYDFNAHPIAPIGTKVVIFENPDMRSSYGAHGIDGWYLGPSTKHYRSYRVLPKSTLTPRVSDTLAWHPATVHMPGSSPLDLISVALQDLTSALKVYCSHPMRHASGSPLPFDETLASSLREASNLFADICLPARIAPDPPTAAEQRVATAAPPALAPPAAPDRLVTFTNTNPSATLQRVPPIASAPTFTASGAPALPDPPITLLPGLQRKRRQPAKQTGTPKPAYRPVSVSTVQIHSRHYFDHINRRWKDTTTNERFKITAVVLPFKARGPGSATCYFKYFDTLAHNSPPNADSDYEYTPCSEILQSKSKYVEFIDKPKALAASVASQLPTPNVPGVSIGTARMAALLSLPQRAPAVTHRWVNNKRVPVHPQFGRCAAAAADKSRLNLNADGTPLSYRGTFKLPNASAWRLLDGDEIARLITSGTITAIHRSAIPLERKKDITYYNPKPKEKYNPDTDVITGRIRGTIGGDRVNYPGVTTTSTADILTVKILMHSVVSDRRLGLNAELGSDLYGRRDAKFATADITDFYLGTPMDRPEYLAVDGKFIPAATRTAFGLDDFFDNDRILFRVDKCMYGLPQSGYLSNKHLVAHLATAGYKEDDNVPCLFTHDVSGLQFSLVVDDFGIKYYAMADLQHLISTIEAGGWKCKLDLTGSKYIGVTLAWDYVNNLVDLTMPAYISKGLTRFTGDRLMRGASSPSVYIAPTMGVKIQPETKDDSAPATPAQKLWIQQVNGYFLYYARMLDELILPTCNEISSSQAHPTQRTVAAVWRLLNYLHSHPTRVVRFTGCDMVYIVDSDASFQSRDDSISVCGGYHRLVDKNSTDRANGTLLAISCQIPTVCQGASEAEYAALYINGSAAAWIRTNLAAMNFPQNPTVITTDNLCAQGIANRTLTARKSKAIAMRYHWIRDRVRLGEYIIQWRPGSENRADFFTKHLPIHKFIECAQFYSTAVCAKISSILF